MRKIDQITLSHPDNIMFTGYPLLTRQDIERAFIGSGMVVDPSCRVQYSDEGLLATFRAGADEMEPWFAIAWGTLRPDERETWLLYWHKLEKEERYDYIAKRSKHFQRNAPRHTVLGP